MHMHLFYLLQSPLLIWQAPHHCDPIKTYTVQLTSDSLQLELPLPDRDAGGNGCPSPLLAGGAGPPGRVRAAAPLPARGPRAILRRQPLGHASRLAPLREVPEAVQGRPAAHVLVGVNRPHPHRRRGALPLHPRLRNQEQPELLRRTLEGVRQVRLQVLDQGHHHHHRGGGVGSAGRACLSARSLCYCIPETLQPYPPVHLVSRSPLRNLVLLWYSLLGRLQLLGQSILLLGIFHRRQQFMGRDGVHHCQKELEDDLHGSSSSREGED